MGVEVTGLSQVMRIIDNLVDWSGKGSRDDVDRGAKEVAKLARKAITTGSDSDRAALAPLAKSTLEGPIRRQGDSRIRGNSGSIPLNATGQTAASISSKKTGTDEWEISSDTERGDMILASNAKQSHSGSPWAGDTPKPVRDPLTVSEAHMDALENELLKGIDGALER